MLRQKCVLTVTDAARPNIEERCFLHDVVPFGHAAVAWIGEPGIHLSQGSQDPMLVSSMSPQAVLAPVTLCLCMHTQKYRDSLEPVEVPKD